MSIYEEINAIFSLTYGNVGYIIADRGIFLPYKGVLFVDYICCGHQMTQVFKRYVYINGEMKARTTHVCHHCGNQAFTDTMGEIVWTDKDEKPIHATHDKQHPYTKGG